MDLVENFSLSYETFIMAFCHFRDLPDFQSFKAPFHKLMANPKNDSR